MDPFLETFKEKVAEYERIVNDLVLREINKGTDRESLKYLIAQKMEVQMKEILDFLMNHFADIDL